MAYRNLFFVALVAGGVLAAGCSSGEGRVVAASDDDGSLPSASGDQSSGNGDQPPGNDDRPPSNPDRPPSNPDQPPGSGPGGVGPGDGGGPCDDVCDSIEEQCEGGQGQNPLRRFCSAACTVPDGATAVPCLSQLAAALQCAVSAGGLCATEDQADALEEQCQSQLQAFGVCREAAEPDEPGNCTDAGGCQNCANDCASCICDANGDVEQITACGMDECMP